MRGIRFCSVVLAAVAAVGVAGCGDKPSSPVADETAFVSVTELDPTIIVDARYFGEHNFIGGRINGYDAPKCLLPVLLQLCRDETIIGITSCVTALRETRLVLSLLEFQIPDTVLVFLLFPVHPLCLERCFDRHRLDGPQELPADGSIDTWAAEGHAPWQPHHKVGFVAAIHRAALRITGIGDGEALSASAADHHP